MSQFHARLGWLTIAGTAAVLLAIPLLFLGCDRKKTITETTFPTTTSAKDSEATALAGLETQQDVAHCRTILQQIDALDGATGRPTLSETERTELVALMRLTTAETAEISQATFSQTDAAYLEECLFIRTGVRSLHIDSRPPLERARLGFEWACRIVYRDDRIPWPANPWTTLEGGSGIGLSRAYVVLAVWQQLGLDGCLVGPPALKNTPSVAMDSIDPQGRANYAPVRACGLQVGEDLYLFDAHAGKALPAAEPGGVLKLAHARQTPDSVKGWAADEVKSWQPFLAPPLAGLSRRMEWLEQRNPGGIGPKLYVNLSAQRERFGGAACEVWNPVNDPFSASRVLARFATEEASTRTTMAVRDRHRLLMTPLERIPKTNLDGQVLGQLTDAFLRQFGMLRYAMNTPRDLLVRGQYREATRALEDVRSVVDNARDRMDQDKSLQKDFDRWAAELQTLTARSLKPAADDPGGVQAKRAVEQFRNAPRNRDIERAFVLGHASRPLAAEVAFLLAECVHERAEHTQAEGTTAAKDQWRNAAEWWQRFLDASAQANSPFPAREPHARLLLARCELFAGK